MPEVKEAENKNDNVFTYDQLRKVQRSEKLSNELLELDPAFYDNVLKYVQSKMAILEQSKNKSDVFSLGTAKKADGELQNIKTILSEIYWSREKKILEYALSHIITESKFHDTTKMLPFEERLYYELLKMLKSYRDTVLVPVMSGDQIKPAENTEKTLDSPVNNEIKQEAESAEEEDNEKQNSNKMVRIISSLQEFAWKSGKVYGPFKTEDVISLPKQLAELLIKYRKAEEL